MITLVTSMYFTPLNDRHGLKIFFLPGLVRQPRILPCDFKAGMPQKLLQHLQPQARIQQLANLADMPNVESFPAFAGLSSTDSGTSGWRSSGSQRTIPQIGLSSTGRGSGSAE